MEEAEECFTVGAGAGAGTSAAIGSLGDAASGTEAMAGALVDGAGLPLLALLPALPLPPAPALAVLSENTFFSRTLRVVGST